jgi:hypothetical protein
VTILPAWKLDAVYCAGLKVGAPQVSLAALCTLHELLVACESRLVSADGNTVTQEALDAIAGEGGGFSAIDIVNPQLPVFGLELVGQLPS